MAEGTHEPTPRRQRRAREQGDSPVSSALIQAATLLALAPLVAMALERAAARAGELLVRAIRAPQLALDARALAAEVLGLTLPLVASCALAALVTGLVQTGGVLRLGQVAPDLGRLAPARSLARPSMQERVFRLARTFVLAGLIAGYALHLLRAHAGALAASTGDLRQASTIAATLSERLVWFSALAALGLALLDVWATRGAWLRRLRMTRRELELERREAEGDAELRARRKAAHAELLAGVEPDPAQHVHGAAAVIHSRDMLAVALAYDAAAERAPVLLCKASGAQVAELLEAAAGHAVPSVQESVLARHLFELEPGAEIPVTLYGAVAEVLGRLPPRQS